MTDLDLHLQRRLDALDRLQLRRHLREWRVVAGSRQLADPEGRVWLNFASNDYLGLAHHREVRAAAARAAQDTGAGAGASRLITGTLACHRELEREIAAFKGVPSALTFSTGHATALGTIPALVGAGDFVLLDRLAHACLVDGARLSGARIRVWRHNDVGDLVRVLKWVGEQRARRAGAGAGAGARGAVGRALIVTESVFSMDGDVAPLREIASARDEAGRGTWLMVDEAHATGVHGAGGRGWIEAQGLGGRVEVVMGTLGKAAGAAGGFVAGSTALVGWLVNAARSFLFSTAPVPAAVGAARAALGIMASEEGDRLRKRLWERVTQLHRGLGELGWELPAPASPIFPLVVGGEEQALAGAAALQGAGVFVPAIRYPTVRRGRARLRITVSAAHEPEDVDRLVTALRRARDDSGLRPDPSG